jgi:hypothetical protein
MGTAVPDHVWMPAKHLRDVPVAGMTKVAAEAVAHGFAPDDPSWINLGQGQPEIGAIPGAPPRIAQIDLSPGDHAYGPVNGVAELREAVAGYYNRRYRAGRRSRYEPANVAIVGGGRPALARAVAALGHVDVGYLRPDYSAYEDLLDRNAPRIRPVGLTMSRPADLIGAATASGVPALLLSNPRNPTGDVLAGDDLGALVAGATAAGCALLVDEFYSHYVYDVGPDGRDRPAAGPVSAAAHVDDVARDPVVLFDGLTKNFRYPGWRLGWIVGPVETIAVIERVGQALDGGPSKVVQRAALAALEPGYADAETTAVRAHFAAKRNVMVDGLRTAGIDVPTSAGGMRGTFYVWGSLARLPEPLRDGQSFFRAALAHRVITVPGRVFDLNPGGQRTDDGAFDGYVRFSYGPPTDAIADGVARLRAMVDSYR